MKLIVGAVVACVIAIGLFMSMRSEERVSEVLSEPNDPVGGRVAGTPRSSGTLASLFDMDGSYRCSVSSTNPQGIANGTVHVQDGNVHGEFNTSSDGEPMRAYLIKNGETIYTWSSVMAMGIQVAAETVDPADGIPAAGSQLLDSGASVDYSCEPAVVDSSMFTPPADIEFMDMRAGIPAIPDLKKMLQ